VLEERVAALEGGVRQHRHGQRPGRAAPGDLHAGGAGSHIVASTALYGGSHNLLHYTLSRFGVETSFVKPGDIDGWRAAIRPEHPAAVRRDAGNPGLDVLDIPTVGAIAHEHGLPLLVDSTFTTPYLMRPFEHGADSSTTPPQVPLRPRHRHRRRAGRQRAASTGTRPAASPS
jgi:O-acetylhomoserine (thiol)-lyase